METNKKAVIRDTDAEAVRLARLLTRTARHGALAVIDPAVGAPRASRVAVATDQDGTPLILVSSLTRHTPAMLADPRCSLLLGEPGKGDPLAHPRVSIACRARPLVRASRDAARARFRYLSRHPKAKLYADFADFSFFRLEPLRASLNAGFGQAYEFERGDLVLEGAALEAFAEAEPAALDHMNRDHAGAVTLYASHFGKAGGDGWTMSGLDPEGFDLIRGNEVLRVWFDKPLERPEQIRPALADMASRARQAAGKTGGAGGNADSHR